VRNILPACLLFLPLTAFGFCWQLQEKPYLLENNEITGIFTYEQRPLRAVVLNLEDASGKLIAKSQTDSHGAFGFHSVKPGSYRLRMLRPSYERVDVILRVPQPLHDRTSLRVNFFADYCQQVTVVPSP